MKTSALCFCLVAVLCACHGRWSAVPGEREGPIGSGLKKPLAEEQAIELIAKLRPGMSFKEVARFLPLCTNHLVAIRHGGEDYGVPFNGYTIGLTFGHPVRAGDSSRGEEVQDSTLIDPPWLLKDGKIVSPPDQNSHQAK